MRRSGQVKLSLAALVAVVLHADFGAASSHREAPLISEDPTADNTDLYAFASPDGTNTVTLLAMYIGLEEPGAGPNWPRFSDDVLYEIKVDNNGDAIANDVVYQFRFTTHYNPGAAMGLAGATGSRGTFFYNVAHIDGLPGPANFHGALLAQTMDVTRLTLGGRPESVCVGCAVAPTYVSRFAYGSGGRPAPDDTAYTNLWQRAAQDLVGGAGRVFAGPTDDPFFADLGTIFDNITFRDTAPAFGYRGGGYDYLAGYNVHTIALQVPIEQLVRSGTPTTVTDRGNVIGVYATASRPRMTIRRSCRPDLSVSPPGRSACLQESHGQFIQVSRLGIPLVNELLIPLALKDSWNSLSPTDDATSFGQYLLAPSLPTYVQLLYGPTGLRAAAGYMAPSRPVATATVMNNDMLALIVGSPGLTLGTPTGGFAAGDLLRFNVRTAFSALPTNAGNPTLGTGRSRLGAAGGDVGGFPNGRRLFDDVVDIEERYVLNTLGNINAIPFGDGVDGNDNGNAGPNGRSDAPPFRTFFPYVQIPLRGDALLVHRQEPTRPM